jgi:PAS domain S-box-containing protein
MKEPDSGGQLRVLILEDRVADAELCERELMRAGLQFESRRVDTLAGLESELEHFAPHLILSDFSFPGGFDGLTALDVARRKLPGAPFIFVSGTIGEERAVEAMRNGAADYIFKDRMGRLGQAARQALELARVRADKERVETALGESEIKYNELIDQASDGIFVTDREGNFLLANPRYREMLGYGESELPGMNIAATYPLAERDSVPGRLAQLAGTKRRVFERMMVRKDGRAFPVEISVKFLPNGTHQGIVRDITERKRQEQKIEKMSRVRAVSSEITSAIIRSPNRMVLYSEACRIAIELGNFGIAWIGSYDAGRKELTPVASAGLEQDSLLSNTKLAIRDDTPRRDSVLAVAIREKRPVYNNDIVADADVGGKRRQEAIRRGYRSVISLPLIVEGNVVAGFSLFAKEANFFDEEEVEMLAELACNLSFGLVNMARQEKLERLSRIRAISGEINGAIVRIPDRPGTGKFRHGLGRRARSAGAGGQAGGVAGLLGGGREGGELDEHRRRARYAGRGDPLAQGRGAQRHRLRDSRGPAAAGGRESGMPFHRVRAAGRGRQRRGAYRAVCGRAQFLRRGRAGALERAGRGPLVRAAGDRPAREGRIPFLLRRAHRPPEPHAVPRPRRPADALARRRAGHGRPHPAQRRAFPQHQRGFRAPRRRRTADPGGGAPGKGIPRQGLHLAHRRRRLRRRGARHP